MSTYTGIVRTRFTSFSFGSTIPIHEYSKALKHPVLAFFQAELSQARFVHEYRLVLQTFKVALSASLNFLWDASTQHLKIRIEYYFWQSSILAFWQHVQLNTTGFAWDKQTGSIGTSENFCIGNCILRLYAKNFLQARHVEIVKLFRMKLVYCLGFNSIEESKKDDSIVNFNFDTNANTQVVSDIIL